MYIFGDATYVQSVLFAFCKHKISLLWKDFPAEILCVQFSFCFFSLQFNFVKYVIVACELPKDNSLDQRMLLKN